MKEREKFAILHFIGGKTNSLNESNDFYARIIESWRNADDKNNKCQFQLNGQC